MLPILEVFTNSNGLTEGKRLTKPLLARVKPLTILLLILMFTVAAFSSLPKANAETEITSITPPSGYVGTQVELIGNISTENGQYSVQFDEVDITSGTSEGYEVNASFYIPSAFAGNHNVTLVDVTTGEKDTMRFTVLTWYSLKTDAPDWPAQGQEGDNVTIFLDVTGGIRNETFVANITVQDPTEASYTNLFNVTIDNDGNASASIIYPENFPAGACTNFTGDYSVFLNETTLVNVNFTIGLTNLTEYHRFEYVDIKAAGYDANENVTITVSFKETTIHSKNVTANGGGLIRYTNWTIPSNASIGNYTVNVASISADGTEKTIADTQNFSVSGFNVDLNMSNLAGDPIQDVTVQVYEEGKLVTNGTSGAQGFMRLKLEIGNYTSEAYYRRDKKVGALLINVTGEVSLDFPCNLTNLRIFVKDEADNIIPEVELHLVEENETLFESTTSIDGIAVARSLLPDTTYVVNASRYNVNFNTTSIPQLPTTAWYDLTVICPTLALRVNVTDTKNQPIHDATVEAQELMGGLHYEGNTVSGAVTLSCTFGRYRVGVYANGIKLNETTIDLFENESLLVKCTYYGLNVYVKVVDYFDQLIPNVNVTMQREGLPLRSNRTEYNGVATFSDFIGGSVQIAVYLGDQAKPTVETASFIDSSTTIGIKIEKYVFISGILVETSHLTTAMIIVVAVIFILSIEIYRRKRVKSLKSSS